MQHIAWSLQGRIQGKQKGGLRYVKTAIFGLTHWFNHRITRKLLKIDRYMLRGVWQALNCLSIHATYCVIIAGASPTSYCWMRSNRLQLNTAKTEILWLYHRSTFSPAAAVTTSSWHWRSYASFYRSWPRYIHRLRRLDEVTRYEDRLRMLRRTASAAKRPPVRS